MPSRSPPSSGSTPAPGTCGCSSEGRADGEEPELGALVRAYWELQRVTGRADLRNDWRSLADLLWQAA